MRQVALRLRDGQLQVLDVPPPLLTSDGVLIDVRASLLSAGTERSKVYTGRKSLIGKARARPDQTRQVIEKARQDGIRHTLRAVRARLEQPTAMGYSAAGVVREVGSSIRGLSPGDRVACGGGDYAVHADVVHVPGNLCVPLPPSVAFEAGAFATVGSVAMHGVRQADARLGELVAVIGLGLDGQLTAQILRAAGCQVIGVDVADALVRKALDLQAVDVAFNRDALDGHSLPAAAMNMDAVIITASTTSSDPIDLAGRLCRDRGRVVVVGDVGIDVPRDLYYERELDLRLSRSYGPGRYDRQYEERGLDYPIGYVRWTEQRNLASFLDLVASGRVNVDGLIVERVPVDRAVDAYERALSSDSSPLGLVLQYDSAPIGDGRLASVSPAPGKSRHTSKLVNVIGTGSFAQRMLIPGLARAGFELRFAASARGLSARAAAQQFGFESAATLEKAIGDPSAGLVAIATRHSSHAELAVAALGVGKNVFVEKPPCLTHEQLLSLREARAFSGQHLFVGFNRRFSPLARMLREHVRAPGAPIELIFRINAGPLAPDHWLNDPEEGGGRLLGEGCHFVDFARWVAGSEVSRVQCSMKAEVDAVLAASQGFTVVLEFVDGSTATIVYTAQGASSLSKEYVEAHAQGRTAVLDDFRSLKLMQERHTESKRVRSQDKGHVGQWIHMASVLHGTGAVSECDPLDSMDVTLSAMTAAQTGQAMPLATLVRDLPAGAMP